MQGLYETTIATSLCVISLLSSHNVLANVSLKDIVQKCIKFTKFPPTGSEDLRNGCMLLKSLQTVLHNSQIEPYDLVTLS